MMDLPLNAWTLFNNAGTHHRDAEVVTCGFDRPTHRYTYGQFSRRTQQLMHALDAMGLARGARVATLAWNSYRHLEAYFAVPCTERVLHTVNIRLSGDDLTYVLGHAHDVAVFVDPDFLPLVRSVADRLPDLRHVVVMTDELPSRDDDAWPAGVDLLRYEDLLEAQSDRYPPIDIAESTPLGLCYTSGTTGRPKGVEYTHRSTFLHALAVTSGAAMSIGPSDAVLPQVPMFHASAWGIPFAAVGVGAKQVFYAGALHAPSFVDALRDEAVTVTAGVPTVWFAVADELAARQATLPDLRHVVCGGSQPPRALIDRFRHEFGIPIIQAWGMTETSPLASTAWPQHRMRDWDDDRVTHAARAQAGLPLPGIEVSIRDDDGDAVPFDGETMGVLHVRGPWVADRYLDAEGAGAFTSDGWFNTGDVAIGSPGGYFVIADRTKDLIKSGGEWISSVDMEAAIMAMADVVEAAVIAVPDDKWLERPLACVVVRPDAVLDPESVREHLERSGFARWQLPDRIEVIDEVPRTAVGKFDKKALRSRFS